MKAINRVLQYIEQKGLSISEAERLFGLSNGYLGKQLKRAADFGESKLIKILEHCPDMSPIWLLTGEGSMLKQPCNGGTINNFSGGSIYSTGGGNNRNNTLQEDGQAYQAAAKQREIEIGRLVAQYRDFIDHLNAQIREKDEQLRTKDEQIARLLSIITPHPKG